MKHNNLSYAVRSDIGNRDEQEDCVATAANEESFAAAVCDGMGGLGNGKIASSIAIERIVNTFREKKHDESVPNMFLNCIDILDEAVYMLMDENGNKLEAGTTIVSVYIDKEDLYWMSVGDSRLYIIRNNEMAQATRDHNYSLYLDAVKDSYVPTAEDLENSEALISFLGMGGISTMDVSTNPVKLLKNDIIFITSDGLYKALPDDTMREIIMRFNDVEDAADELIKQSEAVAPNARDNISFVLIKI